MKTPAFIFISTIIAVLLISLSQLGVTAQTQPPQPVDSNAAEPENPTSRRRIDFVKTADFYLRDGQFITGKLIEDDKSKITIEQLSGSTIKVVTYNKREVDTRTIHINNVPEHKFYEELGDYFSGRTWDFRDDPDDFIQAARAYEMAKAAAISSERRQEDIDRLQAKIDKLQSDKQTWTEQMRDRAELKKLEFTATFDERIKDLEGRFGRTTQLLDETLQRFDTFAKQSNKTLDGLQKGLSGLSSDISRRMETIEQRIENNRRLIDDIDRYRYYDRRYYY
jgi:hypothetical protein